MKKVWNKVKLMFIALFIITVSLANTRNAYASGDTYSDPLFLAERKTSAYVFYVKSEYKSPMMSIESDTCESKTMYVKIDMKNADDIVVQMVNGVSQCCANPSYTKQGNIILDIGGKFNYTFTDIVLFDGSQDNPLELYSRYETVDGLSNINFSEEVMKITINAPKDKCRNCGKAIKRKSYVNGIYKYDRRGGCTAIGTATIPSDTFNGVRRYKTKGAEGGSVSVEAQLNKETTAIRWKASYDGGLNYVNLNDGVMDNNMIVHGSNSSTVYLDNIPYSNGKIILGCFTYNIRGDLPYGYDENSTPFITEIAVTKAPEVTPPPIIETTSSSSSSSSSKTTSSSSSSSSSRTTSSSSSSSSSRTTSSSSTSSSTRTTSSSSSSSSSRTTSSSSSSSSSRTTSSSSSSSSSRTTSSSSTSSSSRTTSSSSSSSSSRTTSSSSSTSSKRTTSSSSSSSSSRTTSSSSSSSSSRTTSSSSSSKTSSSSTSKIKLDTSSEKRFVIENTSSSSSSSSKASSSSTGKSSSSSATNKKNSSIIYKKISDSEKESIFDKMNNSSSDYIHRIESESHENSKARENNMRDKIKIETIGDSEDVTNCDNENETDDEYSRKNRRLLNVFLFILIILLVLLLLAILLIMLFGVLICEEQIVKNKISDEEQVKRVIVGLKFVSYSDGVWKLNVGDLLFRYNALLAYPGLLFVYLFEEEMIRIMTGYRGEEKREVAREKICREIRLGKAGGHYEKNRK